MGGFDDRFEIEALLQNPLRALGGGDSGYIFRSGAYVHAEARERKQRLQDVAVEILRNSGDLIQKTGLRHRLVMQIGNGKLAHAEEPVGMPGPLDIEVVGEAEMQVQVFTFQSVHDGTVVDAADGDLAAMAFVGEFLAIFSYMGDVDRRNAKCAFGEVKVWKRFLMKRIDLHEDDLLGVVPG